MSENFPWHNEAMAEALRGVKGPTGQHLTKLTDEEALTAFNRAVFFAQVREENGLGDMDELVFEALKDAGIVFARVEES